MDYVWYDARIGAMGTYYYVDDPKSEGGHLPIYEDDYIVAIFNIAKRLGVKITDKMILAEVKSHWKKPKKEKLTKKRKTGGGDYLTLGWRFPSTGPG